MSENDNYINKDYLINGLVFRAISFIIESDGRKRYNLKGQGALDLIFRYGHELDGKEHNNSFWQDKEDMMALKDLEEGIYKMDKKKYKFTGKIINKYGKTFKQIVRISDNLIGGYIQSENNLSHEGNCWVTVNAIVYENAIVSDNAYVSEYAEVYGNAWIYGNAEVYGNARVYGNAEVSGNAKVTGNSIVSDNAKVSDNAYVSGYAVVIGSLMLDKEGKDDIKAYEKVSKTQRPVLDKLEKADRFNSGKPQLSMIDSEILNVLANVLSFGASKYGRYNWKKGLSRDSVMDSMLRHAIALSNGQELDEESGLPHAGHIAANLMFHEYYKKNGSYD